ncbi:MAG: DUF4105 domain-containing protein [Candidatus Riflebacteria bacterium]|nr:DUF4105 domain-containing protein [Candidatus Riflebacteria bacterium]
MTNRWLKLLVLFLALSYTNLEAQVPYKLQGIVSVRQGQAKLTTDNGRVFKLEGIGFQDVAKFDEKDVVIEGDCREGDELGLLKVKTINLTPPVTGKEPPPPPFKSWQRPAVFVSNHNGEWTIGNVRWGVDSKTEVASFRIVKFKPELVENVYYVLQPFAPKWIAAHSLMLFTFKHGGMVTTKGEEATGLFLSVEAYQRINQHYDLVDGLKKAFGISYILASWDDMVPFTIHRNFNFVPYPTTFSPVQKSALLQEALKQATVNRSGEYYDTLTNNCSNNLVILMNHVLEPNARIDMWWLPSFAYNLRATVPVWIPKMLKKHGLVKDALPEINEQSLGKSPQQLGL